MRQTGLVALVLLALAGAGCGGNSTSIGVSITPAATSEGAAISVIEGQTQTFSSSVTGGSTTTVYWQICLPVGITSPPTQPTVCTPIPGVTSSSNTTLTGYGTITQNGVYTAPQSLPKTNPFVVMATSTANSTAFDVAFVRVDSGIRVSVLPTSATIGTQESYAVTAAVSGTSNTGVTWSVNNLVGGDSTTVGSIVPGGSMCNPPTGPNCATYTAPAVTVTATITATSAADSSQSGKTTISVSTAVDPKLSSTNPTSTEQGAAQQDIYVQGSGFFSTSTILASGTPLPTTWVSTNLIRGTIPSSVLAQAAPGVPIPINVERQNGDLSSTGPLPLAVNAVRPSIVASAPDSVPATTAGYGVNITGGFFAPTATGATFNGFPGTSTPTGTAVNLTFTSSRQVIANIPAGALTVPGLYPVVLQNPNVPSGSSTSFTNIAVEPPASTLASIAAGAPITVGSTPSAIAIDQADGFAVVANTGGNSVSIINLASNTVTQTVAVGNQPTGVAVDDGLPSPIAVVVNSKDNTVSTISNLSTNAVVSAPFTLPSPPPPQPNQPSPAPYSIGINPATHRAIVTYASTNVAAILDLSTVSSKGAPTFVQLVGGSNTNYGTGSSPQVSIDPRLNWAVVTAGGSIGNVNFVDLGRNPIAGIDPGRAPSAFGILSLSATATSGVAGVGVNVETHDVLLTMPNEGNFTTFSLMDQTVSTIPFTNSMGGTIEQVGYYAAAVNALSNIGIAVNKSGNTTVANTAAILDLQNHIVLGQVPVGNSPVAVAVDPATNEALVVNQADNTVSPISLGVERSSASLGSSAAPQITLSTPEVTFTSSAPLALTVNGGGFASGAQVYLDGTPLQTLSASGGQIVATVPSSMLASARRYAVFVANPAQSVISNIEDLTVIQPIPVGAQPFGVAIDQECDVAAVTNSGDDTVSIVALTTNSAPPAKLCPSSPTVGTVGAPTPVGTTPQGVAISPLLELAVVANNGSNNASVVDLTQTNPSATIQLCGGSCTGLGGVTINQDIGIAYVTGAINNSFSGTLGNVAQLALPTSLAVPSTPSGSSAGGNLSSFFLQPVAAAFDQYIDYLGLAIAGQGTASQPSTAQVYNVPEAVTQTSSSIFALPTGIVFDPLNQVFVVADSLTNNVAFLNPTTALASFAQVGMNPTALDYNYQTSTLVTANNQSHTMSIIEYVCPPTVGSNGANGPNCVPPEVRSILAVGGSPQFSISIDIQLNLAVLTDESNNRVLLIPLP